MNVQLQMLHDIGQLQKMDKSFQYGQYFNERTLFKSSNDPQTEEIIFDFFANLLKGLIALPDVQYN